MRDFFIGWFESLVSIIVILMGIGVVRAALAAMLGPQGGFFAGVLVLVGGGLYTVFLGGMMYLALGIYHNTRRTAEAVETLASKSA